MGWPMAVAAGVSALGSYLSKRKEQKATDNPSLTDTSGLVKTAETGAANKRKLLTGMNTNLAPLTQDYLNRTNTGLDQSQQRRQTLAGKFMSDLGKGQNQLGQQQYDQAKQQILGDLPELQRAARESAAATGGLQRGAATEMVNRPVQEATSQLGGVAGGLAIQSQAASQQGLEKVFSSDLAFEMEKLGITKDVAQTLLDNGRGDILREALGLAGVEDQLTSDILGIGQMGMENQAALALADSKRQSGLTDTLAGLSGNLLGSYLSSKKEGE